jgi:acetolactate synthase I/III small subunit
MRHTIQALVENKFGVLARISSLFSARGYNIDSLAVGITQDPTVSCITFVVNAKDEKILEQIKKQLNKLIDVITVLDLTKRDYLDRELLLLKVNNSKQAVVTLSGLEKNFALRVLEQNQDYIFVEFSGDHNQVKEIVKQIKTLGIKEIVRTGKIAITK